MTAGDVNVPDLQRWLGKARDIQWDYKNLVRRKGEAGAVEVGCGQAGGGGRRSLLAARIGARTGRTCSVCPSTRRHRPARLSLRGYSATAPRTQRSASITCQQCRNQA